MLVFRLVRNKKYLNGDIIVFSLIFSGFMIASYLDRYTNTHLAIFTVLPANALLIFLLLQNHRRSVALEAELRSGLLQENQNLRIENQTQQQILRHSREAVLRLDRDDTVTYCNAAFEKLTALQLSEIVHMKLDQVAGREFLEASQPAMKSARRGESGTFEVQLTSPAGDELTLIIAAEPLLDSRQKFNGTHLGFIDSTELASQRDALDSRLSQQEKDLALFRAALTQADDALVLTDKNNHIVLINAAFTRLTGFTAADLLGQRTEFYRLGKQNEGEILQELQQGKSWHGRAANKRKDGSRLETTVVAAPIHAENGELTYILWTERDAALIKQQRREKEKLQARIEAQEKAYRELEEQFEIIFSVMENGVMHLRPDGRCVFMNQMAQRQLGYTKDELPFKKLPQFVPDLLRLEADYGEKMQVRVSDYLAEFTRPNGEKNNFRWRGMPVWSRNGEPLGVVLHIFEPETKAEETTAPAIAAPGLLPAEESARRPFTAEYAALLEFSELLNTAPAIAAIPAQLRSVTEAIGWPRFILYAKNNETGEYEMLHAGGFMPKIVRQMKNLPCAMVDQYLHSRFAIGDAFFLSRDKLENSQKNWAFAPEKLTFHHRGKWRPHDVLLQPLKIRGQQVGLLLLSEPDSGEPPSQQSLYPLQKLAQQLAFYLLRKMESERENILQERADLILELARLEELHTTVAFAEKILKKLKQITGAEVFILGMLESPFAICSQKNQKGKIKILRTVELNGLLTFFRSQQKKQSTEDAMHLQKLLLVKMGWTGKENIFTTTQKLNYKRQLYGQLLCARESAAFTREDEQFLRQIAAQLARLLANSQLIGEIESKAAELETANALISEFLANVSHELRTPLHAILSYVELMRQKSKAPEKERARHLETIRRSGKKLLNLINDLLDLSKIEAGKIEPRPGVFAPRELLQHLEEEIAPLCRESGLDFHLHLDSSVAPYIRSDSDLLERILLNLARNAQKYTEKGGVFIAMDLPEKERLRVQVRDTGIGIPENDLTKIFEPFQQLPGNGQNHHKGSGLGLAICKSLIELLGGTIAVKSVLGEGTEFTLELPVKTLSRKPREKTTRKAPPVKEKRTRKKGGLILLVDDDESTREAMRFLLENAGYRVEFAGDGERAITLAQHLRPELILLDVMMPGMDGLQTTRILKSQKQLRHIPVIALTARAMQEDREMAIEAGCDDFLTKPFEMDVFIEMVAKYI